MKILVLSDVHYPLIDDADLSSIIREEKSDKIIFLGDSVSEARHVSGFLDIVKKSQETLSDVVFIQGDEDSEFLPCVDLVAFELDGSRFVFVHGDKFNIGSEHLTFSLASALHKINKTLPAVAYATVGKIRYGKIQDYLILGHAHVLAYFPRLKVVCAGCLTKTNNLYNDRGYVIIESDYDGVTLTVKRLGRVENHKHRISTFP